MIVKYTQEEYDLAKSTDKLPLQCEKCGNVFYAEKKSIKFEINHNRGRLKFCSVGCSDSSHHNEHHLHCENCGKEIIVSDSVYKKSMTKHFFCSNSCSASYNNKLRDKPSKETRNKTRNSLLKFYKENFKKTCKTKNANSKQTIKQPKLKEQICQLCGKKYFLNETGSTRNFCSKKCSNEYKANRKKYLSKDTLSKLSEAGRRSSEIQAEKRRSKNEEYFCELCEKHFINVKHNEPMFNGWDADVIVEDIKYAILWNGKWHYEKIKESHSVKQVQKRDDIKIKEIKKCGYVPYVIKDMGKYNPQFVEEEFKKFINIAGE